MDKAGVTFAEGRDVREYVLCACLLNRNKMFVAIRKNRPTWQAGRINLPGGKLEAGETPQEAASREFAEETGMRADPRHWRLFGVMCDSKEAATRVVWLLTCDGLPGCLPSTQTDEQIILASVQRPYLCGPLISNVPWIVAMAAWSGRKDYYVVVDGNMDERRQDG